MNIWEVEEVNWIDGVGQVLLENFLFLSKKKQQNNKNR